MAANKDSTLRTFTVIGILCLVCSFMVCIAVVTLQPLQAKQIQNDRERSILEAAGIGINGDISKTYAENIEARLVNLANGKYVPNDKAAVIAGKDKNGMALIDGYNFVSAARLPDSSVAIEADKDTAKIRNRAKYMPVYLVKNTVSGGLFCRSTVRDSGALCTVILQLPATATPLWESSTTVIMKLRVSAGKSKILNLPRSGLERSSTMLPALRLLPW